MTNKVEYKAGDEVVLNCTEGEFIEGVFAGNHILKENFKNGVAVVEEVVYERGVVLREVEVDSGGGSLTECELKYIKHKPLPQTRTTYEKVTFSKLSEVFAEHEKAPLYYKLSTGYMRYSDIDLVNLFHNNKENLYRKVETPLTPMEAAKEACRKAVEVSDIVSTDLGMCDFVCDKNAEEFDEDFLTVCRAIVNAYDGVE